MEEIIALYNGIIYWQGDKNEYLENEDGIRQLVQGVAEEDGFYIDTDEVDFMSLEDYESEVQ